MYCKKCGKEIYLLFCWIILNTLVYFIIGNPCEKDFFPDLDYSEDGFGNHTYIVCTFLAPLLYWAFREGIKYLQIHSTMNTNSIKIISLIVGIIPVFFLFTVLAMIIGKIFEMYSESIIQLNFVLAIIGVEFFYRDLFTTKK